MKKKTIIFGIALPIIAVFVLFLCGKTQNDATPKEFYERYLNACKVSYTEAVDFVYFDNDWEADFYVGNPTDKLLEYEILGEKEINNSLFAFQVKFESASDRALGKTTTAYNFVGIIDGEYKVITNTRNVPAPLQDNFDETEYQNTAGDNEVSPNEVM